VGDNKFVLPLNTVEECIDVGKEVLSKNERQYLSVRGEMLPFIDLHNLFELNNESERYNVVLVNYFEFKLGLVTDEILGEIQAVIKPLGGFYKNINYLTGASILGDGSVALILDVPKLVMLYQNLEK
jgi:two-component system chemotaxis sensor kinase CheA